jgi:lysine-N-methylase
MILRKPSYYDSFCCIASACPDSCCHLWEVELEPEVAERYRAMEGELGQTLRSSIYQEDGRYFFANVEGRCPMWRRDGLCRLQVELGEEALSHVCREFPRLRQDYGEFLELGLEMSCPEAARLMLSCPDWIIESAELSSGEPGDYDRDVMDILLRTRPRMLELLGDERLSVPQALAAALLYAYHVQEEIDGGERREFSAREAVAAAEKWAAGGDVRAVLEFYTGLEILTDRWPRRLASPDPGPWRQELRTLARYGVWRYYLQAVSDYDLAGRMKMVILHCLVVRFLGGDVTETAALYAKEIENNAENLDAILDAAYAEPSLTDSRLLDLLLHG